MGFKMAGNHVRSSCTTPNSTKSEGKTNLIVNYLPQNMSQDDILSLFSRIAPVDFCKLIRDKITGQSLGYAFVNFREPEGAEKAVHVLNGLHLQNKVIKVSFARPSSDAIKGANIYVNGLPPILSSSELEQLFSSYGLVINSRVLNDRTTGYGTGVGFVRFDKRSEAEKAISELNGTTPKGWKNPIGLKFANHPSYGQNSILFGSSTCLDTSKRNQNDRIPYYSPIRRFPSLPLETYNANFTAIETVPDWCLFVYNLGPETRENALWQLFVPFNSVTRVKVIRNAETKKCRGYGFVRIANFDDAIAAIESLNGAIFRGRVLHVSFKKAKRY